ncbi:olfactory receptor 1571-like [Tupaia chinensis]|uniref:olfactory receptor 1571-like n=1 Tax=Tupaia chinensis TaxID=246437 RepID=UPI000FFC33C0|nr:olfactory receptor 1571-like [Tupaia chinensis]
MTFGGRRVPREHIEKTDFITLSSWSLESSKSVGKCSFLSRPVSMREIRNAISITNYPGRNSSFHKKKAHKGESESLVVIMEAENGTQISEFLLLGLSGPLLFGLFLSMYLITTPMYFFLSNLSFADICFTSTTVPKMLVNIQTQSKVITYAGCITQVFFYIVFAVVDDILLTVMAYDRYVAICHPLHYMVIMNPWLCGKLVLASWTMSVLYSLLHSLMTLRLSFCTHAEIPHFFCELNQVVHLACSDPFLNDMVIYFASVLLGVGPLTGILYTYCKIVSSIRAISSTQGKHKAFSTCASHLSVVSLFYCTGMGVYLSAGAVHSSHSSAAASVLYTVVTPMLNPFIYSLRNKDIKRVLMTFGGRRVYRGRVIKINSSQFQLGLLRTVNQQGNFLFFPYQCPQGKSVIRGCGYKEEMDLMSRYREL